MPPFYADLHIHSKFSRACSRDCDLEHLALVGRRKGISVIGTGDMPQQTTVSSVLFRSTSLGRDQ